MNILITGAGGFIGFHLAMSLLEDNKFTIFGIDNMNNYYDKNLKESRIQALSSHKNADNFFFKKIDISNRNEIEQFFKNNKFEYVVHLAAQAGVRHSISQPHEYIDSNIHGFLNIIEGCRYGKIKHFLYASSSSVYGASTKEPFSTSDRVDNPISLYAASKKSNELMAYSYSHLYNIPSTGLRFFTVYGPYGRPDMAYFKFTKKILSNEIIDIYNNGIMKRDFTYIDDIVDGVKRLLFKPPSISKITNSSSEAPYKIYNIGNNKPISLIDFISIIEEACGKKANRNFLPMQPGDVPSTFADIDDLIRDTGFIPNTSIEKGINEFVKWYKDYYL